MTALVWPVTVIMAVLLIGVWHLSVARLDVHTAAAAAARAASLGNSPADAVAAADQATQETLGDAGRTCGDLTVEVDTAQFTHGGHVEVRVVCQVTTGDLIGLGAPGTVATSATARSPIEVHRHLQSEQQP